MVAFKSEKLSKMQLSIIHRYQSRFRVAWYGSNLRLESQWGKFDVHQNYLEGCRVI